MQVVEQTAVINAPPAIVMEAVNHIEGIPRWATVQGSVQHLSGQGAGALYNWFFEVGRFKFKGRLEIVEQTGNSLITRTTGDVDSIWTITATAIGSNRTALRAVVEYTLPHAPVEPLVDMVLQRLATPEVAGQNMQRFKSLVEERARVAETRAASVR